MNPIEKHKPVLYLHSDENYFPVSIEDYMSKSQLLDFKDNIVIDYNSPVVSHIQKSKDLDGQCSLRPNLKEFKNDQNTLPQTPYYANMYFKDPFDYIQYSFIYPFNGPYNICGIVVGDHNADLEHITVEISQETQDITRIYFSRHSDREGKWVLKKDIQFENGHPVIYVALNSHANYNTTGTQFRILGFANDKTEKTHLRWIPDQVVVIDGQTLWNQFRGHLGYPSHVNVPLKCSWWENEISAEETTNCFCYY